MCPTAAAATIAAVVAAATSAGAAADDFLFPRIVNPNITATFEWTYMFVLVG